MELDKRLIIHNTHMKTLSRHTEIYGADRSAAQFRPPSLPARCPLARARPGSSLPLLQPLPPPANTQSRDESYLIVLRA